MKMMRPMNGFESEGEKDEVNETAEGEVGVKREEETMSGENDGRERKKKRDE